MPNYFQEIKENKLGTIILGTNLCLGILQRFNSNCKNEMPKAAQHTIFTKNLTSGQVKFKEKYWFEANYLLFCEKILPKSVMGAKVLL